MFHRLSCNICGKNLPNFWQKLKRNKSNAHWTNIENRKLPRMRALDHFDDFYQKIYGEKLWRSLRIGLLCNNKYCAVVNNYSEPASVMQDLENRGALNLRILYNLQKEFQTNSDYRQTNEEKSKESIQRMEQRMDDLIQQKGISDKMSAKYSKYERALDKDEVRVLIPEVPEEEIISAGKMSLVEGLSEAHIDHSRIIDPRKPLSASILHEFIPATRIKGLDRWISEADHYEYYKKNLDFPITVEPEMYFNFPEHLNIYAYEKCNVSSFPHPQPGKTGVLDFYLLDGSSVLPVLALNLQSGDVVLDMCGAPGGKALTAFQTLYPDKLVCNDVSQGRVNRIQKVVDEYLFNCADKDKFKLSCSNGLNIDKPNYFNKILVDAPCTNDRLAVTNDEYNLFMPHYFKERLQMPEKQADLLAAALKLVAPGGTVVYSTCTLSPVQNDGVVQMALRKVWDECDFEIVVKDLSKAFKPLNIVYSLGIDVGMKYGILALPHLTANFGPMYVSKLVKLR